LAVAQYGNALYGGSVRSCAALFELNQDRETMTNIHLIGGEKGGVGKSLVARVVAQYLIDRSIPFLGFDSDRSHGALLRFYAGYASPVVIDRYDSLDAIVEAAAESPERRILVDLAAQSHEPLAQWIEECGLLDADAGLGLSIRYWHVMDSGKDCTDLLKKLLDQFGQQLNYVIVLNQVRGNDFGILEQSGEKQRALALNADIITIKRLHDAVVTKIDAHSASFWAAAKSGDKEAGGLGLLERQRVRVWLKDAYDQLDLLDI
jgi:hypothetical protein